VSSSGSRKEVVIVNDKQEQLIEDLVAAANGYQEASGTKDCAPAKEAPRVTEPCVPLRTPVLEPKNETKPKRKYVRKPKVDTKTDTETKPDDTKTDDTKPSQIGETNTDETKVDETKPKPSGTNAKPKTKAPAKTSQIGETKTQDTNDSTGIAQDQDEQELEIDVEPITIDGQHFLIDATHNLYHTQSFLPLGTFKNNSLLLH
jgi:hypothetical protein